jgi:hypothetical protein
MVLWQHRHRRIPGMIVDGLTGGANIYEPNIVQITLERQ